MRMGWWRHTGLWAALAVFGLAASAPSASAQTDDRDCRCVDADGNAIENCTCFVMPNLSRSLAFVGDPDFDLSFATARPRLGVSVSSDQDDALDAQGALVVGVMDDGPADEAGIREGDIITSVDGRSLLDALDDDVEEDFDPDESIPVQRLLAIARELEAGETVDVGFVRDGEPLTASVEVQDLAGYWRAWAEDFRTDVMPRIERFRQEIHPELRELREELRGQAERARELARSREVVRDFEPFVLYPGSAGLGVRLTELTPGLGDYFGTEQGVLVTDVDGDSPLGLEPGDVILRIGDREVDTPQRVRRILSTYDEDESVTLRILRRGSEIDVMGRLSD